MRQAKYAGIAALVLATGCNVWGDNNTYLIPPGQASQAQRNISPYLGAGSPQSVDPEVQANQVPGNAEPDYSRISWPFTRAGREIVYTVEDEQVGRAMDSWITDIHFTKGPIAPQELRDLFHKLDTSGNRVLENSEMFEGGQFVLQRPQVHSRYYEALNRRSDNASSTQPYQRTTFRNRNSGRR